MTITAGPGRMIIAPPTRSTVPPITAMAVRRAFFFSSRRRHTRCSRDWSSDVCSSDLPADSHSGGAKAAKVADYIEQFLSETDDDNQKALWREGLRLVDLMSRHYHQKSFVDSGPEERIALQIGRAHV